MVRGSWPAVILLSLVAVSCGDGDEVGRGENQPASLNQALVAPPDYELSVTLPLQPGLGGLETLHTTVLGASERLMISSEAYVPATLSGGLVPILSNSGQAWTEFGAGSIIGSLYAAGTVHARSGSTSLGEVFSPAIDLQAAPPKVRYHEMSPTFVSFARVVTEPTLPQGYASVERQVVDLPPGNYGNYSIKGDGGLRLHAGRYFFRSLSFERSAELAVLPGDGSAAFVYVSEDFTFRGDQLIESDSPELFVGLLNNRSALIEAPFQGAVVAPKGSLMLSGPRPTTHRGQFFARAIEVRSGVTVELETFQAGLWEDDDLCGWGAGEKTSCDTEIACPGSSERLCHAGKCSCAAGLGTQLPADGCVNFATDAAGQTWLELDPDGDSCTPEYACSGVGVCDELGYCNCHGALPGDGSECTEPVGGSDVLKPVVDGVACASGSGNCSVEFECAAGACSCPDPILSEPGGPHPSCVQAAEAGVGADGICYTRDCRGGCSASMECSCTDNEPIRRGRPFRVGTQNVQALASIAHTARMFEGCVKTRALGSGSIYDWRCMANTMAARINASDYDVLVLNEAFQEDFRERLVERVQAKYPYILARLEEPGDVDVVEEDSGLMLLSRWPFDQRVAGEKDCFHDSGEGITSSAKMGEHSAAHFETFDDADMSLGWDAEADKGLGHARVVSPYGLKYDVFFTHAQSHDETLVSAVIEIGESAGAVLPANLVGGGTGGWVVDPVGSLISLGTEQDDTENWEKHARSAAARKKQLQRSNEIVSCVAALSDSYSVVFAGDLNINGDLSNPAGTKTPTSDETGEPAELWVDAVHMRNEWDAMFNWNGATPTLSARALEDTWSAAMTPQECVPDVGAFLPAKGCEVATAIPDDYVTYQKGPATYDRGFTWAADPTGEQRLDYLLLGDGDASSPSATPKPSRSQHTMRAFNLRAVDGGASSFARTEDGVKNGNLLMSDHLGVNAWVDEEAAQMSPAQALDLSENATFNDEHRVQLPMKMEYDSAVHWFKVSTPGEYVFNANPLYNVPSEGAGADNGLRVQVYEATELSSPGYPIRGEVLDVPPRVVTTRIGSEEFHTTLNEWIPGFRQARYQPANFPIYIKVFAAEPDKIRERHGNYLFTAKRVSCSTQAEACNMLPEANQLDQLKNPDFANNPDERWTGVTSEEAWFKFNVERSDLGGSQGQDIDLYVVEPLPADPADSVIDNVALIDPETGEVLPGVSFVASTEDLGQGTFKVWRYSESGTPPWDGSPRPLNDRANAGPMIGQPLYLRVQKKPGGAAGDKWYLVPGYTTSLTWMFGAPYRAGDCQVDCKETQEPGNDEIYMAVNVGGFDYLQHWIPNAMGLVGRPESGDGDAKDGAKLGDIDEPQVKGWSNRFFEHAADHPDGTSFQSLPAIASPTGNFQIGFCEDDGKYDECGTATYTPEQYPSAPAFDSPKGKISLDGGFWGDGRYDLLPCGMAHYLGVRTCQSNDDCTPPTICDGKGCR